MTLMILVMSGFTLGLISSGHCLGMCGPIAFFLGSPKKEGAGTMISKILPLVFLCLGKTLTYGWIGLLFGWTGHLLTRWSHWMGFAKSLPLISGAMIVLAGIFLSGAFPRMEWRLHALEKKLGSLLQSLKKQNSLMTYLSVGVLWGFLPCPMVLVPALGAAVSGGTQGAEGALKGFFMMMGFGLGTMPALLAAGFGGGALFRKLGKHLSPAFLGLCIAVLGVLYMFFGTLWMSQHACCHSG